MRWLRLLLSFLLALLAGARLHGEPAAPVRFSGRAMGTTWSVTVVPPSAAFDHRELARAVAARLEALEAQFSTYRADSEVSRFNAQRGTDWFPVSPEVARVAILSREISALTGGAFDPTVGPLVRLWGFGPERRVVGLPRADEISAAQARVGWRNLEARLAPPALRKRSADVAADFSSSAKGFAADEIARLLGVRGLERSFVQIAGDIRCTGGAAPATPWRVGIEQPHEAGQLLGWTIAVTDGAVSTSGDYRNYFVSEGRRYGHVIDPRTGEPAATGLAAVTVVASSCATSSALATGLFVLGPVEGWRLAEREHLACLFVERADSGFRARATPEFERLRVASPRSIAPNR